MKKRADRSYLIVLWYREQSEMLRSHGSPVCSGGRRDKLVWGLEEKAEELKP